MPLSWNAPVELSPKEERILRRCKAKKFFAFLRLHRHQLFDAAFQQELLAMYGPQARGGDEAVSPVLLCLVTLLQAALHVSDADAVEEAATDLRWQMVLNCVGAEEPPFSQALLPAFRARLIRHQMDRRLLERTADFARQTGGFGHRNLRAAFDSSPLFGAGRVEDTFNLLGHAARELVRTAAARLARPFEAVAAQAGIPLLNQSSIKAGLDLEWSDPGARRAGLSRLLHQLESLVAWLQKELAAATEEPPLKGQLETLQRLITQDTEPDPDDGRPRLREGVARERQISLSDPEMRHGRKSKKSRVDGYKRHLAVDLESRLIVSAAVTPANRPDAEALPEMLSEVARQARTVVELHLDRGYLGAAAVAEQHQKGVAIRCKPFPLRNGGLYTKAAFELDFEAGVARCPQGVEAAMAPGRVTRFPAARCDVCPVRAACTRTKPGRGRAVAIHAREAFYAALREVPKTAEGRERLRERVHIEHRLSHVGRSQGRRARYRGIRKNLLDVRRHAAVANLHMAQGFQEAIARLAS